MSSIRNINIEASTIFYSKNQFVFGNGMWGSTSTPNAHGLKAFLDRVPKKYLAHITGVVVEIHCRLNFRSAAAGGFSWVPAHRGDVYELGTRNDATSLHFVSRALGNHFKGLEHVMFRKKNLGASLYSAPGNPDTRNLSKTEVIKQLEKSLDLVLKNANLKEIRYFNDKWIDMKAAVENILSKKPDAAKILKAKTLENTTLAPS